MNDQAAANMAFEDKGEELAKVQSQQLKTLGPTEYALRKLRKDYNPENIPVNFNKSDPAYQQVHQAAMTIMKFRTTIEARRKDLKSGALAWGKMVDAEAKRLTALIEEVEAPWKEAKQAADAAQEKAEAEARELEQKRIDEIEVKVKNLQLAADGLLNANSEAIRARLDKVESAEITEAVYQEYFDAAVIHRDAAIKSLAAAYESKVTAENQAKELAETNRKLAEAQAIIDAQARKDADAEEPEPEPEPAPAFIIGSAGEPDPIRNIGSAGEPDPIRNETFGAGDTVSAEDLAGFDSWWNDIGIKIKPFENESWQSESFRERFAQDAWEASWEEVE